MELTGGSPCGALIAVSHSRVYTYAEDAGPSWGATHFGEDRIFIAAGGPVNGLNGIFVHFFTKY